MPQDDLTLDSLRAKSGDQAAVFAIIAIIATPAVLPIVSIGMALAVPG